MFHLFTSCQNRSSRPSLHPWLLYTCSIRHTAMDVEFSADRSKSRFLPLFFDHSVVGTGRMKAE